ncbi:Protein phosphatase 2C C10F6.17c [Hypsizygus marmoreus]|uniref:Protein phosphatase 2C C10F6.17c n=1 Tax=Hypsizygus marmoreus TaxID=39966 RepID=A0A369K003_HYPMA|nr:Protein phosphatase 2C C10F6.17c [Hypsizygus marmoreus]
MSRTSKYTDMGWPEYDALWKYDLLSEPELTSELARLAEASSSHDTDCVTFQPFPDPAVGNQDRYVVLQWPLANGSWLFRAVFDGHAGHDTVDHVVKTLPDMIKASLITLLSDQDEPNPSSISDILADAISAFDNNLTRDVLQLFPDQRIISELSDDAIRILINDHDSGGKNAAIVARCMRGSTVLTSLVDPARSNLWVASLGDSQAVLGVKRSHGHWETSLLSSFHNGTNPDEKERILLEHPGEPDCVMDDRVLGAIAVTRAVGDHLFKLPSIYTERIFKNAKPGFSFTKKIDDFLLRNKTPPYLSNRPDVRHVKLGATDSLLIMCSDGLLDLYEDYDLSLRDVADLWVKFLGRRETSRDNPNRALSLLREALGGEDADKVSRMMTVEMDFRWMDDTTIVVQRLR